MHDSKRPRVSKLDRAKVGTSGGYLQCTADEKRCTQAESVRPTDVAGRSKECPRKLARSRSS